MKVDGIEAIYTWEDIPQDGRRYTQAGQTYPEPSPYDRLLIDRHVRFVGIWSALEMIRRQWKTIWVELTTFKRP